MFPENGSGFSVPKGLKVKGKGIKERGKFVLPKFLLPEIKS